MANDLIVLDRQVITAELRRVFDAPTTEVMLGVLERVAAQVHAAGVTREDFSELKEIIARTEALQERTAVGLAELRQTVAELAEAQKRTEIGLAELRQTVAETQVRTDEGFARMQNAINNLTKQVGGLSNSFGGEIEDMAYIVLHDVLQREFGWKVEPLERTYVTWDEGRYEEIDILGQAQDPTTPNKTIWIVGEAKHNLTVSQVQHFAKTIELAREHLTGEIFAVCFCYRARPEVVEAVKHAGLRLVYSYGRMV